MQHETTMSVLLAITAIQEELHGINDRICELDEAEELDTVEGETMLDAYDKLSVASEALFKLVMPKAA